MLSVCVCVCVCVCVNMKVRYNAPDIKFCSNPSLKTLGQQLHHR